MIRFAHPTGRPSGAQQTTLCLQQQKVTKKCRNLTTKLEHDGCISQGFLSSSFREIIAKRYRGYFFLCCTYIKLYVQFLPFSEIIALPFPVLFFFERHAELNSKKRPLGTVFTCFKIKRGLLNLFVAPALCFEKV